MTKTEKIMKPLIFINGPLAERLAGRTGATVWVKVRGMEKLLDGLREVKGTREGN